VTTFRLAIDRLGRNGADFVTVKTWDRVAEAAAEHLTRGRRVAVQGRLAHEEWVGSDGRRAERLTVVADRVEFLDAPQAATDTGASEDSTGSETAAGPQGRSRPASQPRRGGPSRAA
jgi:single-strand DNA-binding protein